MRHKRMKFSALIFLVLGLTGLHAQEAITVAGGCTSGSGGSTNYTVGQMVINLHCGSDGSVAEGVQQPFVISELSGIPEADDLKLTLRAYPNPVKAFLMLSVKSPQLSDLHFQLFDLQGKLLQSNQMNDSQTLIDMSHLVSSTYFVKVLRENSEIKTFKIVKH